MKGISANTIRSSLCASVKAVNKNLTLPQPGTIFHALRAVVGSVILLTVITAILIPQVMPVSGNSFVNVKLEWIRTPIQGDLNFGDLKVGDSVLQGTVLGSVTNTRADDYFLTQLKTEKSSLESALFSLQNRKEQLTRRGEVLRNKANQSLSSLEEKTKIQVNVIQNELARATDESNAINERIQRYEQANEKYKGGESFAVVSRSSLDSLVERELELITFIAGQEAALNLLESNLESALTGNFVSENTPLEQRQLLDTEQSLINVNSEIKSLTLKSEKLATQINSRLEHLNKNSYYELVSGVSGKMWDIGYPDGSFVNHGDSVVAIADTSTVSVEGNFHQRYLDNVKVGYPATIDLMGSSERLTGTVSEVKIRDQIKSADLSAFNLDSPDTNEFKVVVKIDEGQEQDLYIGQRAKVIVSKSSSSIMPSILLFFN